MNTEYKHKVIISFKTNIINTQKFSPVYLIFILAHSTAQHISTFSSLLDVSTYFSIILMFLFVHIFPNKMLSIMRVESLPVCYLHVYFIKSTLIFSSRFLHTGKLIFQSVNFPNISNTMEIMRSAFFVIQKWPFHSSFSLQSSCNRLAMKMWFFKVFVDFKFQL